MEPSQSKDQTHVPYTGRQILTRSATREVLLQHSCLENPMDKKKERKKIPWTEELDRLQSMGSQRVKHNCETEHAPMHRPSGKTLLSLFSDPEIKIM